MTNQKESKMKRRTFLGMLFAGAGMGAGEAFASPATLTRQSKLNAPVEPPVRNIYDSRTVSEQIQEILADASVAEQVECHNAIVRLMRCK